MIIFVIHLQRIVYLFTINTPTSQIYINIPREDSVISLLNSYLEINFEVIKRLIFPDMELVNIYDWLI